MFANTLTLTIDGAAKTLLRNNQDNFGSFYEFRDGTEHITMQIRHSTDKLVKGDVLRHNVFVERTIFETPSEVEKYFSATVTLRSRWTSAPADLLDLWTGVSTLVASLDDGLVIGEN